MKFLKHLRYWLFVIVSAGMLLSAGCGNKSAAQSDDLQNETDLSQDTDSGMEQEADAGEAPDEDGEAGTDAEQTPGADAGTGAGGGPEAGMEAGQTPGTEEDAEQAQGAVSETEDHVFQTWEAPLADGRILRLEAVGRQVDEYFFGVREVRVYDGDTLLQTVLASEGYWHEDYTETWEEETAVQILDLNFDGNMDFGLFGWVTNNMIPFYYWTWDAGEGCYRYAGTLQGAELLPETEEVMCSVREGGGSYWAYDYYHPNADGELLLVRTVRKVNSEFDIMERGRNEGRAIEETWVPRDGVEIFSTDEEIPENTFVLIRTEILFKEVHDDGVSYFQEIWELKDGELQMISREEVFL